MSLRELIITTVDRLPLEKQMEVLDFVEFLGRRSAALKEPRPFGLCKGEFVVPDDFDAPLPEEILSLFEGQ